MRRWVWLLVAACAEGRLAPDDDGGPPSPADAGGDRVTLDAPASSEAGSDALDDGGVDAMDAGCSQSDAGLGGIGVPAGTTASASSSWQTSTADKAIDGDLGTGWNAGGTSGSLTLTFAAAQPLNGVRLATAALPQSSETYTVYGYSGMTPTMIGQATLTVPQGVAVLSPINVTPGGYDAIRIDVASSQSWASIVEVSILTPNCP